MSPSCRQPAFPAYSLVVADASFEEGSRWLPPRLLERGYTCLSLNMRDHDLAEPPDFHLSHHDIQPASIGFTKRGFDEVVVLGHGYGCNKAVVFASQSNNTSVKRYVLATLGSVRAIASIYGTTC